MGLHCQTALHCLKLWLATLAALYAPGQSKDHMEADHFATVRERSEGCRVRQSQVMATSDSGTAALPTSGGVGGGLRNSLD